jgi:hypothetical protein
LYIQTAIMFSFTLYLLSIKSERKIETVKIHVFWDDHDDDDGE